MEQIRSIIVGVVGFAVAVLTVFAFAAVGLAMIGFAVVVSGIGLIAVRLHGRSGIRRNRGGREPRIWNDGRGTIIDM